MFTNILDYLVSNKVAVTGATATLAEVVVIIVNTWRKLRNHRANLAETIRVLGRDATLPPLKKSAIFLWAINPLNLLRQP
jgi:hypothetical protein